tara:strand:+ start:364 stop:1137 length:774 start_codon:yes stop_codon:yes gene_type:complete
VNIDFSIVIPTLNSEKYLKETIRSIISQDKSINIQLIFSDGGSKDQTLEIIKSINEKNCLKEIIYNQIGLTKALNEGFKKAKGKYLTYLNSDDMLSKNALINIKNNFEQKKNNEWIIGFCENVGDKYFLNNLVNFYKKNLLKFINFNLLSINNVISQPSVFWKKSFFHKVGEFDENIKFNMDYDMWLRMIKVSKPDVIDNNISFFRRHNKSLSHNNLISQFKEKYKIMRIHNKNLVISTIHLLLSAFIVFIYKITNY